MTGKTKLGVLLSIILISVLGYSILSNTNGELLADTKSDKKQENSENDSSKLYEAPHFTLLNLEGDKVNLSDYRGKVVFINFWATWCGPCRHEVPAFIELQKEYGEDKLAILGISLDQGDLSVVPAFAAEYGINYEVLYATPEVVGMYGGIRSIPTTFIVDRDGNLRDGRVGFPGKDYFVNVINSLL